MHRFTSRANHKGNKLTRLSALALTMTLFSVTELNAQATVPDLSHPISRYRFNNPDKHTLTFWQKEISFQVVGNNLDHQALDAAARVRTFSEHAGVPFKMFGTPEEWFNGRTSVSPDVNYLVIFDSFKGLDDNAEKYIPAKGSSLNFEDADPQIQSLLSRGITRQSAGCFADWVADEHNAISAFVLAIDNSKPELNQRDCSKGIVPSSFGVSNVSSTVGINNIGGTGRNAVFLDESDIILLIRLSAFCRNELNDYSLRCASEILKGLYRNNAALYQ